MRSNESLYLTVFERTEELFRADIKRKKLGIGEARNRFDLGPACNKGGGG